MICRNQLKVLQSFNAFINLHISLDYIHRVGRTGRAGNAGTAISFLTDYDAEIYCDLRIILQKSSKSVIPQELLQHEASRLRQKEGDRNIT